MNPPSKKPSSNDESNMDPDHPSRIEILDWRSYHPQTPPTPPRHMPTNPEQDDDDDVVDDISLNVQKFWYFYQLKRSPHWSEHPGEQLTERTRRICDSIYEDMPPFTRANLSPIERLVREYIANLLPLTRLKWATLPHLIMELHDQLPSDPGDLTRRFIPALYQTRLKQIREAVRHRRIFLSFTREEFALVEPAAAPRPSRGQPQPQSPPSVPSPRPPVGTYLFVIVGTYKESANCDDEFVVEHRFALRAVRMIKCRDRYELDGFQTFKTVLCDSLRCLYPGMDLEESAPRLVHLISDPALHFSSLVDSLRHEHPALFGHLLHVPYAFPVMNYVDEHIRRQARPIVECIDTVRMLWTRSADFRRRYLSVSSRRPPPESFADSVRFYRDHYDQIRLGTLAFRRAGILRDVYRIFSDEQFGEDVDRFTRGPGEILVALDRLNRLWWQRGEELSIRLAALAQDLAGQSKTSAAAPGFLVSSADFPANRLITRLLAHLFPNSLSPDLLSADRSQNRITAELNALGLLFPEDPAAPEEREWTPSLDRGHMYRSFMHFMSMFSKWPGPVVWDQLEQCAVVYCAAEELGS